MELFGQSAVTGLFRCQQVCCDSGRWAGPIHAQAAGVSDCSSRMALGRMCCINRVNCHSAVGVA